MWQMDESVQPNLGNDGGIGQISYHIRPAPWELLKYPRKEKRKAYISFFHHHRGCFRQEHNTTVMQTIEPLPLSRLWILEAWAPNRIWKHTQNPISDPYIKNAPSNCVMILKLLSLCIGHSSRNQRGRQQLPSLSLFSL